MVEKISYKQMKNMYLDYFVSKGHKVIQNASLIPENDPTVLFTTAGMHPLVPYLLGESHPEGKRLVNVQRCIRTGDIEEVGDTTHLTFFEMLGNWSLGDYFKKESLAMSHEFLTKVLKIDQDRLTVTVFAGDDTVPRDMESFDIWKSLGLRDDQIFFCGRKDNWWGPAGQTGPCGPDSEMFIAREGVPACGPKCGPDCGCKRYVEVWNNVFMQYNKNADGSYSLLSQKNVDTGMGLERILSFLNGVDDVYRTELFADTIAELEKISGKKYVDYTRAFRKVADHVRSATFILGDEDGVAPSNTEQGYILRRIIRSAIRSLKKLDVNEHVLARLATIVVDKYKSDYPILEKNRNFILTELDKEETLFNRTIQGGLKEINKVISSMGSDKTISGEVAFRLYDTFGFPLEFTEEVAAENGLAVDVAGFHHCFSEHQEKSRKGAEHKFKGGLADDSEMTTRLHTATHMLQAALRKHVDPTISQKGSNITPERLRFDFSLNRKVTPEELAAVEKEVNDAISKNLSVCMEEMSLNDAQNANAIGLFAHKYDAEKVKVYSVGGFSKEVCGGPHVQNTSEMGHFKILKEEASSAGVRRIKAVLE